MLGGSTLAYLICSSVHGGAAMSQYTELVTYYLCESVDQFLKLEKEIGIAAKWTRPKSDSDPPEWVNRWKWKPGEMSWPNYGNDVY